MGGGGSRQTVLSIRKSLVLICLNLIKSIRLKNPTKMMKEKQCMKRFQVMSGYVENESNQWSIQ